MQNFSDVSDLLKQMREAGIPAHQAIDWIARAIKIGKGSERAAQEQERRDAIRIKIRPVESAQ